MKIKYKILYTTILSLLLVTLTGCKLYGFKEKDLHSFNKIDNISTFIENFSLQDINHNFNFKGVDINYKDLNGIINMLNLYSIKKIKRLK
ncbi:hypothetical protein PL321_06735 [Caloramator sp. mosi_1]|uniref:hypothetical protein n=1 Tax=Caloramator sp. mosi_1 TaxID=3023090 RepID=UPI002361C180|nr:hypothetical protein [Caloramator sp. mosi_1]WDC85168.1 hypothetical protein PL321_06735 [Caloramator sp. mosi_1]